MTAPQTVTRPPHSLPLSPLSYCAMHGLWELHPEHYQGVIDALTEEFGDDDDAYITLDQWELTCFDRIPREDWVDGDELVLTGIRAAPHVLFAPRSGEDEMAAIAAFRDWAAMIHASLSSWGRPKRTPDA